MPFERIKIKEEIYKMSMDDLRLREAYEMARHELLENRLNGGMNMYKEKEEVIISGGFEREEEYQCDGGNDKPEAGLKG